jgi:hypothetical protein
MTEALRRKLQSQYAAHPSWTAQLHRDNLEAAAKRLKSFCGALADAETRLD